MRFAGPAPLVLEGRPGGRLTVQHVVNDHALRRRCSLFTWGRCRSIVIHGDHRYAPQRKSNFKALICYGVWSMLSVRLGVSVSVSLLMTSALVPIAASPAAAAPTIGPAGCTGEKRAEADAFAAAQTCQRRVEILDHRTETRQVFANTDGTLTLEESVVPQRVARGGEWVPVDTTLRKTAAGNNVAVGPILLGAAAPVHILTPSTTVRRIVNMTALTVTEANAAER